MGKKRPAPSAQQEAKEAVAIAMMGAMDEAEMEEDEDAWEAAGGGRESDGGGSGSSYSDDNDEEEEEEGEGQQGQQSQPQQKRKRCVPWWAIDRSIGMCGNRVSAGLARGPHLKLHTLTMKQPHDIGAVATSYTHHETPTT